MSSCQSHKSCRRVHQRLSCAPLVRLLGVLFFPVTLVVAFSPRGAFAGLFSVIFLTFAPVAAFGFLAVALLGVLVVAIFMGSLALSAFACAGFLASALLRLVTRAGGVGLFRKSAAAIVRGSPSLGCSSVIVTNV